MKFVTCAVLVLVTIGSVVYNRELGPIFIVLLGFVWPLFKNSPKLQESVGKKKYRLSFVRFYLFLHKKIDLWISTYPPAVRMVIRSIVPTLLLLMIVFLFQSSISWWWIFPGALLGELFLRYRPLS